MRFGAIFCVYCWISALAAPAPAVSAAPAATPVAGALPDSLTAETVVALALARAPGVLEAESRRLTAEAGRVVAGVRPNPELELTSGRPDGGARRTAAELSFPVGPGVARARRLQAAERETEASGFELIRARQSAAAEALAAYCRVLHAERRVELARRRLELAERLFETARARVASGDAARLEAHVGEVEASRARSGLLVEQQGLNDTRLSLGLSLGLEDGSAPRVVGNLANRTLLATAPPLTESRPRFELRAAAARLQAARAELSLAELGRFPTFAFRLNYESDGGVESWMPGAAITLPLLDRGQGERALARAGVEAARRESDRLHAAAQLQWTAAQAALASALAAVTELETHAVPRSREMEAMAEVGYRSGKSDLGSLLLLRRDALDTLNEYNDRLLEAALRDIDLALASGAWPPGAEQESLR